ncbi:MAG TPA: hypothetical protein VF079_04690 [Sphingomicrobium sp.]
MVSVGVAILSFLALVQSSGPVPPPPEFRMGADTPTPVPAIPAEFRSVIKRATREQLTIRALDGHDIPVDISGWRLWDYRLFQNGRYFGMEMSGYEVVGYLLIDRAARKRTVIATGRAPLFSSNGRWFAVAGLTDASQGNFEGVGLWEIRPSGTTRRFFTDALPPSTDWRMDRWVGNCFAFSAVNSMWDALNPRDPDDATAQPAPSKRDQYSLWVEPSITLHWSSEPACPEAQRP